MDSCDNGFTRDLLLWRDQELAAGVHQKDSKGLWEELERRYGRFRHWFIVRLARRYLLSPQEQEDFQEKAILDLWEGFISYRVESANGCCLRTFIARVMRARFLNHLIELRRAEGKYDRSPKARKYLESATADGDPVQIVLENEMREDLELVLLQLKKDERYLWEKLMEGKKLTRIGRELEFTTWMVWDRKEKLIEKLKRLCTGWNP